MGKKKKTILDLVEEFGPQTIADYCTKEGAPISYYGVRQWTYRGKIKQDYYTPLSELTGLSVSEIHEISERSEPLKKSNLAA